MDGSRVPKTGGATGPAARPRRRSRDGAVDRARRRAGARPRPRRAETKAISNRIVDKIGSISEQRHDGGRRHATSATATAKQFCRKRDPGGRECGGISHATLALPAGTHGRDRCRTRHCGSAAARRHDRRCRRNLDRRQGLRSLRPANPRPSTRTTKWRRGLPGEGIRARQCATPPRNRVALSERPPTCTNSGSLMSITSVRFKKFKALRDYSIALQRMNVLVGPNNSGKSTVLSAFRVLEQALRRARSRKASPVRTHSGTMSMGHNIPESTIPISLENVHSDYGESDSIIEVRYSRGNTICLLFPADGGVTMYWETTTKTPTTPNAFRKAFPDVVQTIPVLGPVEQHEPIVADDTVRRAAGTPRASRHFRNYWRQNSLFARQYDLPSFPGRWRGYHVLGNYNKDTHYP